jgi:hypothetical protein
MFKFNRIKIFQTKINIFKSEKILMQTINRIEYI